MRNHVSDSLSHRNFSAAVIIKYISGSRWISVLNFSMKDQVLYYKSVLKCDLIQLNGFFIVYFEFKCFVVEWFLSYISKRPHFLDVEAMEINKKKSHDYGQNEM